MNSLAKSQLGCVDCLPVQHQRKPNGNVECSVDFGHLPEGGSELRVIKKGEREAKTLYRAEGIVFLADWSRDGTRLLIGEIDPSNRVFHSRVIDARTGDMKLLHSANISPSALVRRQARGALMRFSPDGRFVAYSTRSDQSSPTSTAVFVRPVEGEVAQLVAGHRSDAYVFDWSPDGRYLLFISDESGAYDLWALPVSHGKPSGVPRRVRKDVGEVQASGTSDAGTLFYSVLFATGETYIGDLDTVGATVAGLRLLPRPKGETDNETSWSADGKRLLINRRTQESLGAPVVHDVATAQEHPFEWPALPEGFGLPMFRSALWSRDGKSALFSSRTIPPGQSGFVLTDARGRDVQKTFSAKDSYLFKAISPDQRYVFATRGVNELNNTRVVRIELASGKEQEVCPARPIVWAVSPDATQVACGGFGDGIRVHSASGGPGRDLVKGGSFGSIAWTPDGKHILYSVAPTGPAPGYWIIPAGGGQPRKLQIDLKATGIMSLSSDGKKIAVTTTGGSVELWALENVLSQLK